MWLIFGLLWDLLHSDSLWFLVGVYFIYRLIRSAVSAGICDSRRR
jgi:hypothetical protein